MSFQRVRVGVRLDAELIVLVDDHDDDDTIERENARDNLLSAFEPGAPITLGNKSFAFEGILRQIDVVP